MAEELVTIGDAQQLVLKAISISAEDMITRAEDDMSGGYKRGIPPEHAELLARAWAQVAIKV